MRHGLSVIDLDNVRQHVDIFIYEMVDISILKSPLIFVPAIGLKVTVFVSVTSLSLRCCRFLQKGILTHQT